MQSLKTVLVNRDGISAKEADERIKELRRRFREGEDPEELLHSELGLEPDYIFDIIG